MGCAHHLTISNIDNRFTDGWTMTFGQRIFDQKPIGSGSNIYNSGD